MFGMTIEKILVVLVLAAVIVGPHRLPGYAHRLAAFVRGIRAYTEAARTRLETEVGAPLAVDEWRSLDPRQYDPRRIVREALAAPRSVGLATELMTDAATTSPRSVVEAVPTDSLDVASPSPTDSIDGPSPTPGDPVSRVHTAPAFAPRSGGSGLGDLMARGVAARAAAARLTEDASAEQASVIDTPARDEPVLVEAQR